VKKKNKLINQNENTVKKKGRKIKIRIPAEVVDISELEFLYVKVKICGKPTEEILLNQVYSISVQNLELAKSEKSWKMLISD